jgi:integrase
MAAKRSRANGEGSIYPYRNGYAAYAWVNKPDGKRGRKYIYGSTREIVHEKWIKLQSQAATRTVATKAPTVGEYIAYWLDEIVAPNLSPGTYVTYEYVSRCYLVPGLGKRRLDRLQPRDVQVWINEVARTCQCCAQRKDARRPVAKRRCCATGNCCNDLPSPMTVSHIRRVLRSILSQAMTDGIVVQNVARLVRLPAVRKRKRKAWTSDEARRFLESARADRDPLYAAYALILVLGLRKGELLGLSWDEIDLASGTVSIDWQVQRIGKNIVRGHTKTPGSDALLPLPAICCVALRDHAVQQLGARTSEIWQDSSLVFTSSVGTPIEPRTFNRVWDRRCKMSGVRRITVHDARRTCGSLLADLDVHPRVAMQILRHAKFSITMEIYTEVSDKQTQDALRRLGESLDK